MQERAVRKPVRRPLDPFYSLRLKVEPAGGFERPVCRIQFGCSGIELHRLDRTFNFIPFRATSDTQGDHSVRKDSEKAAMEL